MPNKIEIKCTTEQGAVLPVYKTEGAAGADICAFVKEDVVIDSGKSALVPTGLCFEIPCGYEVQVRPRSGLAAKNQVTVLNTPGTIDSDYRGEVKIILINFGDAPFTVHNGDRIAQIVVSPVTQGIFKQTSVLSQTDRGAGGFGSTGVSQGVRS
jgi:dUTP pyrophosphatase